MDEEVALEAAEIFHPEVETETIMIQIECVMAVVAAHCHMRNKTGVMTVVVVLRILTTIQGSRAFLYSLLPYPIFTMFQIRCTSHCVRWSLRAILMPLMLMIE